MVDFTSAVMYRVYQHYGASLAELEDEHLVVLDCRQQISALGGYIY